MDDDSQYDEFGNYIGPDLAESEEENIGYDLSGEESDHEQTAPQHVTMEEEEEGPNSTSLVRMEDAEANQVILHEEKSFYPSAQQVYGEDVETIVQEEDTQLLSEPIVKPKRVEHTQLQEKDLPQTSYKKGFLVDLLKTPELIRNLVMVGHLHHGKSTLMDMLIASTHHLPWNLEKHKRYTDTHMLERQRGMSIKSSPMTLVLQSQEEKSYAFNLMDTPGHVDFMDEVSAGTRFADGALLVVDAVEGVMVGTEQAIKRCLRERIPIILVVNKVERLILELKLPPTDAYFKLRHVIEEVNSTIQRLSGSSSPSSSPSSSSSPQRLSPLRGNVLFASGQSTWIFSLSSFSQMYADTYPGTFPASALARRLWGERFYNPSSRTFSPKPQDKGATRSFVHFILEPLYKIYAQVVGEETKDLQKSLHPLGIRLKAKDWEMEVPDLLRAVLHQFFGPPTALVDAALQHIPSPAQHAQDKVNHIYRGPRGPGSLEESMIKVNPDAPTVLHVAKLYADSTLDTGTGRIAFHAFARVMSGRVRVGQNIQVLGQGYSQADEEEMAPATVDALWLHCSRYRIPIEEAGPGAWVLLAGVDATILGTATLLDLSIPRESRGIFRGLDWAGATPTFKVAVEPVNPTELPKMLEGLRRVNRTYPMSVTRVEESGEHVLLGSGEMYLDCALHDLRRLYGQVEVRVSDPTVRFNETVVEMSGLRCWSETQNHRNKLTMVAEPLDRGIAEDLEAGAYLREHYQWDLLASRSIWAFGPDLRLGSNILCDDTLPTETDKKLLKSVKDSIRQGFQWGTREGPLCDEPIRNVKFKILDATLSPEPIHRGSGQIIPAARRVCYSAFLTAKPRLMEPVNYIEVQAPADCVAAVYDVLGRRRGHVLHDLGKAGSPLYSVQALIPAIDSFGFETDLRTHTQGQAFVQQVFDHWQVVPGDPLDRSIPLRPLEPSPAPHLARDFMLKTRRRKGLSEDVSVGKYFDESMLLHMAAKGRTL
ncbi:P-loop containing nucleoside triphosphate hydrolase protein [Piptocephalis cylindrospora]|uniref:116 kDa U5 small nuclear ribonucleoprotein component n=1 Tax=Piptocephalis cylindrospora TaxID=1907219 RepID=A0A4P9Y2L0_9FUNG|nr:P-loop containing nucleoside triphosphate hydrolase protein [Piptocephalis cylindrospora]|eukprot:RKP12914.1 P-loop containing nucleoside triphosphate hydrolase protein [Piptocephalis cylindrospora]